MNCLLRIKMNLVVCGLCLCLVAVTEGFNIRYTSSPRDPPGTIPVEVNGKTWIQLLPPTVHVKQQYYRADDGSLKYTGQKSAQGVDKHGMFNKTSYYWMAGDTAFITTMTVYPDKPYVFRAGQEFPMGAEATYTGDQWNSVMSGWPVVPRKMLDVDLGFLSYGGIMAGDSKKSIGRWANLHNSFATGIYGGPLALFDMSSALIISPFNKFTAASNGWNNTESTVSWGVMGNASHIPEGFQMETIFFLSTGGINQAFKDWGEMMRLEYGRTDHYVRNDFTNNHLGYWMDGGGYYSYRAMPSGTMQDTVLAMKAQSLQQNLPYRYVEFDEWFYCWCIGGATTPCCDGVGTEFWEADVRVFPDGFKYVSEQTNWPVHGSNKWWSDTTPYAKQNGGKFEFIIDRNFKGSLPVDQCFWDYLMNRAFKRGQIVYEQDFQSTQWEHVWQLTSNVTLGRTWYTQMGRGAELNGLVIQYCMAPCRAILQALEIPTVTQARASGDYRPGLGNWMIGITTMFLNAVGIRPFKDNFFTTPYQPGYNFGNLNETHVDLEVVVATMSMGPVGPSDMLNHTNADKLMRCCNAEGLILQPSFPPTAIDAEYITSAFDKTIGEVWSTASLIGDMFFGIILGLEVRYGIKIYPGDVFRHLATTNQLNSNMMVYMNTKQPKVMPFGKASPLMMDTSCNPSMPCVYHVSPVMQISNQEVVLMGELSKWTAVSPKRIKNILLGDDLRLTLAGMPGEVVEIFASIGGNVVSTSCVIPTWGRVDMMVFSKKCL